MAKGKRKKHRKGGKITFGRTMAAGGEFSSSVGVIISWIIGILMALTGIYLILAGSFGRFDPLFTVHFDIIIQSIQGIFERYRTQ